MATPIDDVTDEAVPGDDESVERPAERSPESAGIFLAGLLGGAGVLHLVMVPAHVGGGTWLDPVAFALVGWAQIALALTVLLRSARRPALVVSIVVNLAVLGAWLWSRTAGLPIGSHADHVQAVGLVDGVTAGLELTAVAVAAVLLAAGGRVRVGRVGPAMASVAVLGLVSLAIVSPDTAGHGEHGAMAGHGHDDAAMVAEMAAIDEQRCDLGFNPRSYWTDAQRMGVDTHGGGAMMHGPTATPAELAAGDPLDGRGSAGLDRLISATSKAGAGEVAAAGLVVALAESTPEDHQAWVRWMGATGAGASGGHDHGGGSAAAPDDNGGHGGHAGPQPWIAMVDSEQCLQLADELQLARDTALRYPTAADAQAAGWVRVTPYVPGIAAHYMNFSLVDGRFAIDEPEMLLYDGNEPNALIVGLSYYLLHEGDAEPSQGFTGPNDHFHRHVGLCTKAGAGVIGDSTLSAEDCEARGGRKSDGSRGWMSHAWVVPGCESPWGVFSGASPILDAALAKASGTGPGCAGSSVLDRYDLSPGGRDRSGSGEAAAGN
jgi:hypothetical protein